MAFRSLFHLPEPKDLRSGDSAPGCTNQGATEGNLASKDSLRGARPPVSRRFHRRPAGVSRRHAASRATKGGRRCSNANEILMPRVQTWRDMQRLPDELLQGDESVRGANEGAVGRQGDDQGAKGGASPGGRYSAKPLELTRTLVLKVESKSSSALRKERE